MFQKQKFQKKLVDFKLPIDDIKNDLLVVRSKNKNTYKLILKVSPINTELEAEDELEKISDSIRAAFSSFQGRFGIYIMSEKADIKDNIEYIDLLLEQKTEKLDIQALKDQKEHLKELIKSTKTVLAFYLVIETKAKSIDIAEQSLNDSLKVIKQELESALIFVQKLNKEEILYLIANKVSAKHNIFNKTSFYTGINSKFSINSIKEIRPSTAFLPKNGIAVKIENKYYRFYSIVNLPQSVDRYCWMKKLFNFNGDINFALILNPKRKDKVLKNMSRQVADNEAFAYAKNNVAVQKKYMEKADSARKIIDDISREDIDLFDVNIFISIAAETLDELDSLNVLLLGKIASLYMKPTAIVREEFEPFYSLMPILVENKLTKKLVYNLTSKDVASIIPFDQSEYMEDKGIIIGDNISSGGAVVVNFRNEVYNNGNMSIISDSGCGKTTFLKTMMYRNLPYTDFTIVFDIKGDFDFSFGKKYYFSPESSLIVNPFHFRNAFTDKELNVGRYLSQKIMDLIVFFKWIIPEMTPYEESIFEEDIRECYKRCGLTFESESLPDIFCTMSTLNEVMEEKLSKDLTSLEREKREYIKACLNPYVSGAYSEIFNGQTNWEFDKFTILDVSNTPEAVRKPLYDILLKDVWQFCKKDGTNPSRQSRKDVYIDEAHEFADERNIQTFEFLARKLVKEGRGFGIRTITATQNLSDFLALRKWGEGILDNSYFKFFMKLGENDLNVAKSLYKFSKAELRIVEGNEAKGKSVKGKGILCVAKQKILVQINPTRKEWDMMEG